MHNIQRHIMRELIGNDIRRYSQLRPERVEPNQFVYHLKQVIASGLVGKYPDGYGLTAKGRAYADKLDESSFDVAWDSQPRSVLFLAVSNPKGDWLLIRRDKQPTYDKVGFIATDARAGEPITTTANAYLQELCAVETSFEYAGSGSVSLYRGEEIESYVFFQLLHATVPDSFAPEQSNIAWLTTAGLQGDDVLPSTVPLLRLINSPPAVPVFSELSFHI